MKAPFLIALLALQPITALHAELPPEIKPTAEQYDLAMETYDANIEAIVKQAHDGYLIALNTSRRRESSGKRLDAVAAIDAEIAGVNAGSIPEKPPAHFPSNPILDRYRSQYLNAPERAAKAVESSRNFTRSSYLKWLEGMVAVAKKGKSPTLEAAAAKEIERVRADEAKESEAAEPKADPEKPAKEGDAAEK